MHAEFAYLLERTWLIVHRATELQISRHSEQTAMPVTEVALACGFASSGHFSYRYRALYGLSPRQARRSA